MSSSNGSFDAETPQRPPGAGSFRLIETMRWEAGQVAYRDSHRARLARSARRFGFAFSQDDFRRAVQQATDGLAGGAHRLRLTLGAAGDIEAEAAPLEKVQGPLYLTLAERRVHSADPFFKHKTTWRDVYRCAFETAQEEGFDDAVLLNEHGEVTEATRANLVVEKSGQFHTPPVRCGLLPGVGRAAWLADGRAEERVLKQKDLRNADALWLVSALRGARRAVWRESRSREKAARSA